MRSWYLLRYEILVPSKIRALILEVHAFHENKIGGEKYWDVFMSSKIVEF